MLELMVLAVTVAAARLLLTPLRRRVRPPGWFVRARERGRPGVPVTTVLATLLGMGALWLIGERRGVPGALLLLFWIAIPLTAVEILLAWRRRPRPRSRGETPVR